MIYDNTNNLAPQDKAEIFQYTIVTVHQAVLWGRGHSGFQVMVMIEWGQNSKPKNMPRASNENKKTLNQ